MVVDKNGVEIHPGQHVLVHQDSGTRRAVVVEPFPVSPTVNAPGHWVDVNIDNAGPEGMPSYILEVVMPNVLRLKRGTVKGWDLQTAEAVEALKRWYSFGVHMSAEAEHSDNPEQKQALFDLIDLMDEIHLGCDGVAVSREDAKAYLRHYWNRGKTGQRSEGGPSDVA